MLANLTRQRTYDDERTCAWVRLAMAATRTGSRGSFMVWAGWSVNGRAWWVDARGEEEEEEDEAMKKSVEWGLDGSSGCRLLCVVGCARRQKAER